MFSFKYLLINVGLGLLAGALGSGYNSKGVNYLGHIVLAGAVIYTWTTFTFGWAVVTFIELMIGAFLYGTLASK